jgi:hypothetical protein
MNAKIVFLLYDSRSGSTYLSALLNRYRSISVSLESGFASHIIEYSGVIDRENIDGIITYLQKEVQFRELGLDLEALKRSLLEIENTLTKKALIQAIIQQYFSERDPEAACYIIKHPPFAYLSEVISMFPDVQFLHIIRDGRAVFNSKKKTTSLSGDKMTVNPLKAAWDWQLKLKKAEQFEERTTTIFYEDLIQHQDQTLQYILDNLPISEEERAITKKQSDYFHRIGRAQKGLHQNVSKSPQSDNIHKWKQELSNDEIDVYNYINQEYLQKYNYRIDQPISNGAPFLYAVYLSKFIAEKVKNIVLLLRKPSVLRLKFNRNYRLLKEKYSF